MLKTTLKAAVALLSVTLNFLANAQDCAEGEAPAQAVRDYLVAMQEHRFADAYNFVTAQMTDDKSAGEWAAIQKLFYEGGEVNILSMDIRKPQAIEDDAACRSSAVVPNVLKSRDKFNNQGTTEFEIYTTRFVEGSWRVDSQETFFDQSDVDRWFPGETIPELRDQY